MRFSITEDDLSIVNLPIPSLSLNGDTTICSDIGVEDKTDDKVNRENHKCLLFSSAQIKKETDAYFEKMFSKSKRMEAMKKDKIKEIVRKHDDNHKARIDEYLRRTKRNNIPLKTFNYDFGITDAIKMLLPDNWLNDGFDLDKSFDPKKYDLKWNESLSKYVPEGDEAISADLPTESAISEDDVIGKTKCFKDENVFKPCAEAIMLFEEFKKNELKEKQKTRRTSKGEVLECIYECERQYKVIKNLRTFYEKCLKEIEEVKKNSITESYREIKKWLNEFFNSDRFLSSNTDDDGAKHVRELKLFLNASDKLNHNVINDVKKIYTYNGGMELVMFEFFNKVIQTFSNGTGVQQWIQKLLLYILKDSPKYMNLFYAYIINNGFNYKLINPNLDKLGTSTFGDALKIGNDKKIMKFFFIINLNLKIPEYGFLFQGGLELFQTLYNISIDFAQIPVFPVIFLDTLLDKQFMDGFKKKYNGNVWLRNVKNDMIDIIRDIEQYQVSLDDSLGSILELLFYEIKNNIKFK
uniref:HECT domain-containing protein n=1 Tax=Parastrongyloides trichosuri TaxID=131310 RepID=A0A0N5A1J8_PARTI